MMREALEFYAKEESWVRSNKALFTKILCFDVDMAKNKTVREVFYKNLEVGGKKAREILKKIDENKKGE